MLPPCASPSAHVLHILSDLDIGGGQVCVLDFCRELKRRGTFAPSVLCLRAGGVLQDSFSALGLPVTIIPFGSRLSPVGLFAVARHIRREKIGIVHTHCRRANLAGRLAAVLARRPALIAHHHDTIAEKPGYQRSLIGWLGRRSAKILCVSTEVRHLREELGLEPTDRLEVLRNFVDPALYRSPLTREQARDRFGLPQGVTVLGIVGRLHPLKRHSLFLAMAGELMRRSEGKGLLHFAVVGEGRLLAELQVERDRLGLQERVHFIGACSTMADLYAALDLVVITSEREGFCRVALEAQAAGKPVVSVAVGGVPETLSGGGGILIDHETPESLADGVAQALIPENYSALVRDAARNVARFAPEAVLPQLERIYFEAVASRAQGGYPRCKEEDE